MDSMGRSDFFLNHVIECNMKTRKEEKEEVPISCMSRIYFFNFKLSF